MNKEDVVYLYSEILLSHKKNEIMSLAATWMDLKIIILSEVSQTEKDKYHMMSYIARRDKKAFLSNQCKEIEENNRMGKTRDLL